MKKILMGLLAAVTLMVLGTCNPFQGPDTDGTITLYIGNRSARAVPDPITVQPNLEYQFTATNGTKMETVTLKRTTTGSMALSPGTWDITAKAYLPGGTVLVGTGSPNPLAVKVVAGQNTTAAFTMVFENTEIETLTVMGANNTLTPTFDPDTATYTVVIPPGATNITVEATPKVAGAELSYTYTPAGGSSIPITDGILTGACTIPGAIEIDVKGSSGYTTTYTVTFAQVINALGTITDITAPVHDGGSATATIPAGTGYTGTFAWTSGLSGGTSGTYVYGTSAEATVTLTAETGYTFTGMTAIDAAAIRAKFSNSPTVANISNTGTSLSFTLTYTVAEATAIPGSVSITGTAKWNQVLTADIGSITPSAASSAYTYQWKRDGTAIGTNSQTYTLTAADEGKTISVAVSRTGYASSITGTIGAAVNSIGGTGEAGGIIFYVDTTAAVYPGKTYLEAAPADMPTTLRWAPDTSPAYISGVPGTGTDIGTGKANTALILGVALNAGEAPAAEACKSLTTGGYTDWFLPSKDELAEMYTKRAIIGGFNTTNGACWSSSQGTTNTAWYQRFSDGYQNGYSFKDDAHCVRAVRAF
ncbi:hypothetical protein FACS1894172_10450 [Spirochaetia bacterium]|nr:hypothetical protein FACS1894164_10600 [Spirochaetia bacterium]GHU32928.1 hypothetical protein FACS1894172_10450 [Spirochaetia bacterium]